MGKATNEIVENLKKFENSEIQLYPVLVTEEGEVIDGYHRLQANPNWKKEVIPSIKTREDILIARLNANYRRNVKRAEVKTIIKELADIFLSKGIPKGELAKKIAEKVAYSEKTILNLLPPKYKVQEKREAGRVSARVRAERREEEAKEEARVERLPTKFTATIECPMCHDKIKLEVDCRERRVTVLV